MNTPDDDFKQDKPWHLWAREASAHFEPEMPEPIALDTLHALFQTVLTRADYHCALTGHDFGHAIDQLQAVPIQPRPDGGALHVDNFLCLSKAATDAFTHGYLTIGPGLEIIVDLSRIDPDFFEQLHPLGRLLVSEGSTPPDPIALAYHRDKIFLSAD
ncbi:hypothetical protein WH87_02705 [Devosia epidermidihirudinis]|uniref:HNH endonuclease n=1 Tax=Devosia epidermidihirudinis TaxID=1293439 RepID=A0A0F5QJA7_9HYPH|nr:hypothetical protein [Devosia epidermidihirudinis]KKC41067.1 hypothetical protein WH87_02705 [Devosia epidermidihirudinis]